jgi:hypothetical protein
VVNLLCSPPPVFAFFALFFLQQLEDVERVLYMLCFFSSLFSDFDLS